MFEAEYRVRLSETGEDRCATIPAIVNYFQDTSMQHSDFLGLGFEHLDNYKKTWVLSGWQIIVKRSPRIGQKIISKTWPTSFKGLSAERNFAICDEQGNVLAFANSIWVFMDLEKKRPVKPLEEDVILYAPEEPLSMNYAPKAINKSEADSAIMDKVIVEKSDIDANGHVNNCRYIEIALDRIQEEEFDQIRVEYKRSAVLGDVICPKVQKEADRIVVTLYDQNENVFAMVEFAHYKQNGEE